MEPQQTISELLMVVTVILVAATVAIPIWVLVVQGAEKKMWHRRGALGPRLRRLLAFLGSAVFPERPMARRPAAPAPLVAKNQRRRSHKRFRTCMMGSLHRKTVTLADNLCDVIDLSSGGARIRLVDPMPHVTRITLGLRHFGFFPARVVWRAADEIGLKFDLAPETVVKRMRGLLPRPTAGAAY